MQILNLTTKAINMQDNLSLMIPLIISFCSQSPPDAEFKKKNNSKFEKSLSFILCKDFTHNYMVRGKVANIVNVENILSSNKYHYCNIYTM